MFHFFGNIPEEIKIFFDEKNVIKIACREKQLVIVCDDGLYVWGFECIAEETHPFKLDFFDDKEIHKVACGKNHILVVCNDGVYAWGDDSYGQLGEGDIEDVLSPVRQHFFDGKVVYKISCGDGHTIVACNDGVYAWGDDSWGQLGTDDEDKVHYYRLNINSCYIGEKSYNSYPGKLDLEKVRNIVCGSQHTIAVCDDGVYAWGENYEGQLGRGYSGWDTYAHLPVKVDFFDEKKIFYFFRYITKKEVLKIYSGYYHTMAVCNDGVYAWGENGCGQLGTGNTHDEPSPVKLDFFDGKEVYKIVCGYDHTMAICNDGIYAWGSNDEGQLGFEQLDLEPRARVVLSPKKIESIEYNVKKIICGKDFSIVEQPQIKAVVAPVMRRD